MEERLFARRRGLFTDLSLVFMDTTTLSFHGAGGEELGAHGYSKDHRPDLRQMVLAVVLDGEGRPVCTEMLPGNTADTTVLLPIVDRLRSRFGIGRVCAVADRCRAAGVIVEWGDLIRDLDSLQEAAIEEDGKRVTTRTHVAGQVGKVFQAVSIALPPNWREHTA